MKLSPGIIKGTRVLKATAQFIAREFLYSGGGYETLVAYINANAVTYRSKIVIREGFTPYHFYVDVN